MMSENTGIKVTIMIPTYKQARFVRGAIESALSQSYPRLEVVVGDDASPDETAQVVARINDPRLKYVRNARNFGRTQNYRNLRRQHATGDFVVNLDGDDYFTDSKFIDEAVKLVGADPNVVMVAAQITTKSTRGEDISTLPSVESATGLQVLKSLPNSAFLLKHMGVLYARQRAIEIDFYRSRALSSDWESLYRLALHGEVRYLHRDVGVWRIHGENESGTSNREKLVENLQIWSAIYSDAVMFGMSPVRARWTCAKCIAFFATFSYPRISARGNAELVKFVFAVVRRYKLAAMIMALKPRYAAKLVLGFIGYYRKKGRA